MPRNTNAESSGPGHSAGLHPSRVRGLLETSAAFLKLGCTSFGGPIAHIGYLRAEIVRKRQWVDEATYGDLVALCQFLPGPASSQLVFALGMHRAGLLGAIVASFCFTVPSAVIMIAFAYGVATAGDLTHTGWLHGLKLAAVSVVAQAVWGMGRRLCPDRLRLSIALLVAAVLLACPGAWIQVGAIAAGAAAGWLLYRRSVDLPADAPRAAVRGHLAAVVALIIFAAMLMVSPILARTTGEKWLAVFDSFYRSGSLVFGGGHVLLPLLRAEVVPPGWVSDSQFLAGYGAAQALPGPLFTLCGYLGAVMTGGRYAWLGGAACTTIIFLPAWLLIGGALPFWHTLRAKAWAQAGLRGANAAVVGVLLAALYNPVFLEGARTILDVAAALLAFGLLELWKAPPWLVVLLLAGAGQWVLP